MLSERQLRALLMLFDERMQDVSGKYFAAMGQHLKDIGSLTPSDVHRLTEMRRSGMNVKSIQREIARSAEMSVSDLATVFQAVAGSNQGFAEQRLAGGSSSAAGEAVKLTEPVERIIRARLRVAAQAFRELSQTAIQSGAYRNAVDAAIQAVQSGVTDYTSAIRNAVREAGRDGLRVQYPSGVTRRLDSAVRQNVLDGVRSLNNEILRQLGEEYGADGVELSAHALCAEDHLPYQGRQFSYKEFEQLQASLSRPIGMWNCKHTIFPIILGVSEPTHSLEELDAYARNSQESIEIDGRSKTRYEWTQERRRIETAVRQQRDTARLAKAAGDDVLRREAQANINALQDRYVRISRGSGLAPQTQRLKASGENGIINVSGGQEYMRILDANGQEKYRYLQTDAIQQLDSAEAIRKYFTYTDKYGDTCEPISAEFGKFRLEVQKELAEGIEWARTTYKLDRLPSVITRESSKSTGLGFYRPSERKVYFKPRIPLDESFATAVHEMTHFAISYRQIRPDAMCRQALCNIGTSRRTKIAQNLQREVVGLSNDTDDWKTPDELVAYSMEREATGKHNKLSREIAKLFLEEELK